eukprot:Sspe_Gene.83477::Locus_54758_Transcript_1_1_Confidence_1.000_Length_1810::g.83477::m.83477/K03691/POFUT; peptide-O-fucosyltransferase
MPRVPAVGWGVLTTCFILAGFGVALLGQRVLLLPQRPASVPVRVLKEGNPEVGKYLRGEGRYLSFEPWNGGWNNRRMSLEIAFLLARATNRTLVLPPAAPVALLPKPSGFEEFFQLSAMRDYVPVLTWDDFSELLPHLPPSQGAPTAPVKCNYKYRSPQNFCRKCRELRQKATNIDWEILRHIIPIDPIDDDDPDFVAYRFTKKPLRGLEALSDHRMLHFPQNLFGLFYQVLYFRDKARRRTEWQAVKNGLVLRPHFHQLAQRVVNKLGGAERYVAVHYRQGDFKGQFDNALVTPEAMAENIRNQLDGIPVLYIASDEKKEEVWDRLRSLLPQTKIYRLADMTDELSDASPNWLGMIEALVCSRAALFIGTKFSTFSSYITRLRGYQTGLRNKQIYFTDTKYKPGEVLHEATPYSWGSKIPVTRMGDFRGSRPYWVREYPEAWEDV